MNNAVFGKTKEHVRKHRDIKLVTTEGRRNCLVSEPMFSYYTVFYRKVISNRNEKTEIPMNKPVYLGLLILELSKMFKYEFRYDYVKPKYGENTKRCYMDIDSFIVHVKTDDIYKDLAVDFETRFDTSNFDLYRPLPKGKNKKVIGPMKDVGKS